MVENDGGARSGISSRLEILILDLQLATMSRDAYRGPKLPKFLLDQVQNGNGSQSKHKDISRKDRRKQERQQKRSLRQPAKRAPQSNYAKRNSNLEDEDDTDGSDDNDVTPRKATSPPRRNSDAK